MIEAALTAGGPPSLWLSYGYTLQALDRPAEAVAAYRRYVELMPAGPWVAVACGNQANCLTRLGDRADAEELYRRALALEPQRISHVSNYVRFLIDERRWTEALPLIDAALQIATTDADSIALWEDRAAILTEQQNGAAALASIEYAQWRGSDSVRTHFLRGRAWDFSAGWRKRDRR